MAKTFDSLTFAAALIDGGFSEQQASALAHAMWELIDSQLATKKDLADLEERISHRLSLGLQSLGNDIAMLEERVDRKLERLRSELIQWMFGVLLLQSGVTAVLFKLLH